MTFQSGSYRERYKSPSYQIKEGECVNVDVTGPGATLALGLMFFNTNNRSVGVRCSAYDNSSIYWFYLSIPLSLIFV